jgi:gliding motility-associated-like protein
MIKSFTLFFLLLLFSYDVKSQIDTSFWFVAPDISQGLGDRPIYLYFNTYSQPATVKIRQPANGSFTPVTLNIPANWIDSVLLTPSIASIENDLPNIALNRGLYISSTQKVSALYSVRAAQNREYFSLKGSKAMGVDFYIPMQEFWDQAPATSPKSFSSFDVVASQNNTTILITPRTNIIGHAANVTYTVLLQQGQAYSCQDTARSAATSLAGSIVSSNKPVAVTIQSGGLSQGGCFSTIGDQITSSAFIGNDYIVNRGTGTVEKIFILATQNNTQLTINDGTTTMHVSNFGENYIYTATQPITYVKSNKPVYVLSASGFGCRLGGAQLPPFFCAGTYSTSFTRANSDSLALNLFTRTGFEGNFALNGNASLIPASAFTVVPGSSGNIKSAKIYYSSTTIPVGSHNIVTNSGDVYGLGVLNGSSTRGSALAYVSEFVSSPVIDAGSNFTICANGSIALNAQVGGGNVNATWSTNGYGVFNSGFTALSNTYTPSQIDTTLRPVKLILTSNGPCPVQKDTLFLSVKPSPLVNASINQIVCGNNNTVTLNGSVSGGATTGIWASLGTGTFSPNNTALTGSYYPSSADTAAGSVKLILTSTGNGICSAEIDTMQITINKPPLVNAGPATFSLCANNPSLSVNGTVSGSSSTGKWTSSGTGNYTPSNIQLSTGYVPSPADVFAGNVTLYLSSTNNGICNASKDSIYVMFTSSPNVNAGVDVTSCKNNAATVLTSTITGPTSTGSWTGGNGTYAPNNTTLTFTYTPTAAEVAAGFVNLTLTSTNNLNCNAVNDQVRISFVPKPFANFSFTNGCLNGPTAFTDFSLPGSGTLDQWNWSFGDNTSSNVQSPTHTYSASTSYTTQLIVRNTYGCYDTIRKSPLIYPLPIANFGITRICTGAFLNLTFTDSTTIASPETVTQWLWDFGGPGQSGLQSPTQLFPGSGLYNITLIASSNHNCKDTVVKQINLTPRPVAGFAYSASTGINVGTSVNFVDTSKYAINWSWTFGDGSPGTTLQNPSTIYYANGVYVVTQIASDSYGCSDTARVAIRINNITNELSTLIPNAISPNGDGKNDIWKLDFLSLLYPNAEIDIYTRWGENIFHSVGYSTPWDGSYKGDKLAVGTYYYVIKLNDQNNTDPFRGGVLLIR